MKTIQLTRGLVAQVDDEDYDFLAQRKWYAKKGRTTYYPTTTLYINRKNKHVKMSRMILGVTDPNILVDHIDRCGLNNQRDNLRICNHSQNGANSKCKKEKVTKYLGVHFNKKTGKWEAKIKKDYTSYYLGLFEKEEQAAVAYNIAAKELHGEFANLNEV